MCRMWEKWRLNGVLCFVLMLLSLLLVHGQSERRQRVTFGDTSDRASCTVQMTGIQATRRRAARIQVSVECNGDQLLDETFDISDIAETTLDHVNISSCCSWVSFCVCRD